MATAQTCSPKDKITKDDREDYCTDNFIINTYYNNEGSDIILSTNQITPEQSINPVASNPCSTFYSYEKSKLETRVNNTNRTESYYPSGIIYSTRYIKGGHISISNILPDLPKMYLHGYTDQTAYTDTDIALPFPTGYNDLPTFEIPAKYTLQNKPITLKLDFFSQNFIPKEGNVYWDWGNFIGEGTKNISFYHITGQLIQVTYAGTPITTMQTYDLIKNKVEGKSILQEPVADNRIKISYDIINKYTLSDRGYYTITQNSEYTCDIEFPQIQSFVGPSTVDDTSITALWTITSTNQLYLNLIGGLWWVDDIYKIKQKRLCMLQISSQNIILSSKGVFNQIDTNKYIPPGLYFKEWFNKNNMGAINTTNTISNYPFHLDLKIHFHIPNAITDDIPLIKLDSTEDSESKYTLNLLRFESNALLYICSLIKDQIDNTLNTKNTILYNNINTISQEPGILTDKQTTQTIVTGISMDPGKISITYTNEDIKSDIYTFVYTNYLLKDNINSITTNIGTIITSLNKTIPNMISNIYNINTITFIDIDHTIQSTDTPYSSHDWLSNYYTDITIKTSDNNYITKKQLDTPTIPPNNNYNGLQYDTLYQNQNTIPNVILTYDQNKEAIHGVLTYGDVYNMVHQWMKSFSFQNTKIKYTDKPINSSNIQFYNQPTRCISDKNNVQQCCNFTTEASIYTCNSFSQTDICGTSGPSAIAIYQKYMKELKIGCVVGKPLIPSAAPAGGYVNLTDTENKDDNLLKWAGDNANIYTSESDNGPTSAIMTWAVANYLSYIPCAPNGAPGFAAKINTACGLSKIISPIKLQENKTVLYQYCDAFGGYLLPQKESTSPQHMILELKDIIDTYTPTNKCWIVPILAFCDIGTNSKYVKMNDSTVSDWWTQTKYLYLNEAFKKTTNLYNLPDPNIGRINKLEQYIVMSNGSAGQWADNDGVLNSTLIIKNLGKPTNNMPGEVITPESSNTAIPTRKTKILLSFGGENVSLGDTSNLDPNIIAQQLVNLVVKYAFDGIDFDLEGFSRKQSDLIWVTLLYGNVKKYFLGLEALIIDDIDNKLKYPKKYKFMMTDAPQPAYFTPEYWGTVGSSNPYPSTDKGECYIAKCIEQCNPKPPPTPSCVKQYSDSCPTPA
jgi:hypothetical protein